MDIVVLVGIAFGLSLDAFTVAVTSSTVIRDLKLSHGFRMAIFFGFFQMIMPILGWAAGLSFNKYIQSFDHWIAFGLLAFVGGRMIWAGLPIRKEDDKKECTEENPKDCRDLPTLFILSVATSIDALAVGLSFAMISVSAVLPSIFIGVVTFIVSMLAYWIGKGIGGKVNVKLDLVGGLVLVGIGVKILIEHLK